NVFGSGLVTFGVTKAHGLDREPLRDAGDPLAVGTVDRDEEPGSPRDAGTYDCLEAERPASLDENTLVAFRLADPRQGEEFVANLCDHLIEFRVPGADVLHHGLFDCAARC